MDQPGKVANPARRQLNREKNKMPNGWRTIKSLAHKIRLHDRRGKGLGAFRFFFKKWLNSFREHRRKKVDEKSCVTFLLCDPGWYVQRT